MRSAGTGAAGEAPGTPGAARSGSSRPIPNLLLVLAAAFLVARVATGVYEAGHAPDVPDLVPWLSIAEGEQRARQEMKPVLYDFTADWCSPCRQMTREVFGDRAAAQTIAGMYVPVRVLDRAREEGRNPEDVAALQARYRVQAFPTLVIVPPSGEPQRMEGYPGRAQTLRWLTRTGIRAGFRLGGHLPGVPDTTGGRAR